MNGAVKVLVVEDDPISQRVMQLMLAKIGYEIDIAGTGEKALALFANYNHELIFMDYGLPTIKGTELIQKIRNIEQGDAKHTYIVGVSAHGNLVREECLAAGMDNFICKPVAIDEISEILRRWMPI